MSFALNVLIHREYSSSRHIKLLFQSLLLFFIFTFFFGIFFFFLLPTNRSKRRFDEIGEVNGMFYHRIALRIVVFSIGLRLSKRKYFRSRAWSYRRSLICIKYCFRHLSVIGLFVSRCYCFPGFIYGYFYLSRIRRRVNK